MAKTKLDQELFDRMRATGLRRRAARVIAESAARVDARRKPPKAARKAIADLKGLVEEIEDRATGGPTKRKAAARKAARTRQSKAEKRSAAAKKGARTRAKAGKT